MKIKSRRIVIAVALISMLSLCFIGTAFAYAAVKGANKIELLSNNKGETVRITDESIDEYLSATDEETQIDILLKNEYSGKGAKSVTLSWDQNGSSFYNVYISEDASFENSRVEKVFGYTPTLELYNLIPGRTYYWKVRGTYSNDTSEVGSFTTKQSAVRAISVDGVSNVRDLGGYKVGSGNVNYGLLYRGGKLNGTVNGEAVTDEGKATMLNRLGIKTEIDLRSESDDGGQTQNAIGENVKYVKIPLGQYANVIDYESWRNLGKDKVSGGYDANNKNAIKELFELLADESNYPVYFHCNAGADRTGTLALLINGLLGVDEQSLIKDYELTTFSRYGRRLRSGVAEDGKSFTSSGIMQNDGGNYVAMGLFIDALKANYTVNGTINEAVYNYLIEYIGLSNETIDRIKGILLSETSSGEECKKIDGVQEILLTDDVKSIDISDCGVELSSVNSIKIGQFDLGKNINALSFDGLDKRVYGEKEIIVCGTGADGKSYRIEVPVLIITKNIGNAEELREIVEYSETNTERYGYYRLVSDITYTYSAAYGANITNASGIYGFKGVLDGKDGDGTLHTIKYDSVSWSNGIFGMIGVGAAIKNVTIGGKYGGIQAPMIGATVVGATFDDVTFNITGGRDKIASMNGLITKCMICSTSFNNVTVNAEGVVIDSLFGGSQYAGYKTNKPCTFDNFAINAENVLELAHEQSPDDALKSISVYSVNGIKGNLSKESAETSTIHFSNGVGYLTIDDEFSDSEIISITFDGKTITDFITLDGMIRFNISELFKESDTGDRKVEIALKTKNGINVKLHHTVDVMSDLKVVDFDNVQQIILGLDEKSVSLSEDGKDYSSMTVSGISCLSYDLGTDINNLNLNEIKADVTKHGNNVITVIGKQGGRSVILTIPVLFVTDVLTKDNLKANIQSQGTALSEGKYFILTDDIDASGIDWKATMLWTESDGFKGKIDGRGHTVKNLNIEDGVPGIFNCTENAVVKNINFTVANFVPQANTSVFGVITKKTLIENVTVTFDCVFTATTGGILSGNNAVGNTYRNVKVTAEGSEIFYLISHASNGGSGFDGVVAEAKKINYIYGTITSVNGITTGETKAITLSDNQDILLTSDAYSVSLGAEQTGLTVQSITCDGIDLGKDLNNLDMSQIKDDLTKHGVKNIVVKGQKNGEKITVIAPVTIITKYLTSGAEFKEAVYCSAKDGEKNKGAYYVIPWNLNVIGTGFTGAGWVDLGTAGFAGTVDGRGHKIVNVDLSDSLGLFNALKGAVIKNVEIEVSKMYAESANASVFGVCAENTLFENITITFKNTFTGVKCGILGGANQSRGCTFKDITVNAQGSDIYRLFSAGDIVKNSKDSISGVVVNAKSVQYIYATTDPGTAGFDVTVNTDENQ